MIKYVFLFLFSNLLMAQEPTPSADGGAINIKIRALAEIKPEAFAQNVETIRSELDRYFDNKKRVCNGEYSTMVLGDVGEPGKAAEEHRKLTKDERKICFREMKNLQVSYINALYEARRSYTQWLQEQQLQELSKVRDEAIKRLQTNFARFLD